MECAHLKVSRKAGRGEKEGKLPGKEFRAKLPGVWRMDGMFSVPCFCYFAFRMGIPGELSLSLVWMEEIFFAVEKLLANWI